MCASAGAPFPLQAAGFCCHDAQIFNREIGANAPEHGLFEISVNLQ